MAKTRGVLLINLGSPDAPSVPAVRRYLNEFLMDPYVIDVPWVLRRLIVSATVLPFRPKRSAHAYRSIWRDDGSPLIANTRAFATRLAEILELPIAVGMRYGSPSIADGLEELAGEGVNELLVIPLYPQHADSSRTTSIRRTAELIRERGLTMELMVFPPFYNRSEYIGALAAHCRRELPSDIDQLIVSYHGLPERQLKRADPTRQHCLMSPDCCETRSIAHQTCYRHQSRETTRLLARALDLAASRYTITYQSRLGRAAWTQPFTDDVLRDAPARGWKRIAVVCPAFVADNLETLEEIGERGRQIFLAAGGEKLTLVTSLNTSPEWVAAVAKWCREAFHLPELA
jgi:ferrochelatase